jgi:hypothetical protein
MVTNLNHGYIKASGDADYNFGLNDFTVEFFAETTEQPIHVQTLFEITNNESPAAINYGTTRFITAIENNNIVAYCIQITNIITMAAGVNNFISPIPLSSNNRIFYNGHLLKASQYTISGVTVTLDSSVISAVNCFAEIGLVLFSSIGSVFTPNVMHFISAERYMGNFYLYLDGRLQSTPMPASVYIPLQSLPYIGAGSAPNLNRIGSPSLLTIGANKDGQDHFTGKFGDFKISNGIARHVPSTIVSSNISSQFVDGQLGLRSADIIVTGGDLVDDISGYTPEELSTTQLYDTLYIAVYQSDTSNPSSNIIGYSIFKSSILSGPVGSYTFPISGGGASITTKIPWQKLYASDASILINGVAQAANTWSVANSIATINLGGVTSGNIQIINTGPTNYYVIAANSVSTITSPVYANSTQITVSDVSGFITPILGPNTSASNPIQNARGKVFINQECITYLYIDRVNNVLSGLMRGVAGTGVPTVHNSGAQIISASYNRDLSNLAGTDPGVSVWYSLPLSSGTSLQNTNSSFSNILVAYGTVAPNTPF